MWFIASTPSRAERPRSGEAAAWAARELTIAEFGERVRVCADPAEQVARITALAQATPDPETMLGIGVADPELLATTKPSPLCVNV